MTQLQEIRQAIKKKKLTQEEAYEVLRMIQHSLKDFAVDEMLENWDKEKEEAHNG